MPSLAVLFYDQDRTRHQRTSCNEPPCRLAEYFKKRKIRADKTLFDSCVVEKLACGMTDRFHNDCVGLASVIEVDSTVKSDCFRTTLLVWSKSVVQPK